MDHDESQVHTLLCFVTFGYACFLKGTCHFYPLFDNQMFFNGFLIITVEHELP